MKTTHKFTADTKLIELLETSHGALQWWAAHDAEEPACVTKTLRRLDHALAIVRPQRRQSPRRAREVEGPTMKPKTRTETTRVLIVGGILKGRGDEPSPEMRFKLESHEDPKTRAAILEMIPGIREFAAGEKPRIETITRTIRETRSVKEISK
jgi:hypothetical protein